MAWTNLVTSLSPAATRLHRWKCSFSISVFSIFVSVAAACVPRSYRYMETPLHYISIKNRHCLNSLVISRGPLWTMALQNRSSQSLFCQHTDLSIHMNNTPVAKRLRAHGGRHGPEDLSYVGKCQWATRCMDSQFTDWSEIKKTAIIFSLNIMAIILLVLNTLNIIFFLFCFICI